MTDDRPTIDRDALLNRDAFIAKLHSGDYPDAILSDTFALLDALDAETRRADVARADLRLAIEQGDCYLAASKAASRERWDAVAERDALAERIAAVRALHRETFWWSTKDSTRYSRNSCTCDQVWPCATVRALDEGAET